MPEFHLREPGFTYCACGVFTKHSVRIQKFKETGDLSYIYENKFDKACFVHDAGYDDIKYLAKQTISDKVLKDGAYEIGVNPKYKGYQRGLASMMYKPFDKKIVSGALVTSKGEVNVNEVLVQELPKLVTEKLKSLCEV